MLLSVMIVLLKMKTIMKLRRTNTYADNGDDVNNDYNEDTKPTLIIGPALKQLHLSTIN